MFLRKKPVHPPLRPVALHQKFGGLYVSSKNGDVKLAGLSREPRQFQQHAGKGRYPLGCWLLRILHPAPQNGRGPDLVRRGSN
ncbi:hypothetical protein LSM04_008187 [Trypanosoma melophagium]|uniref:uncharacterized protein n=1 Tax=Trypanosoma melophagium TaxID=715481 RepID=UPI00351A4FEE|nr:hypothetical protein LSM04_008187 [Trypanosoma melophagium]